MTTEDKLRIAKSWSLAFEIRSNHDSDDSYNKNTNEYFLARRTMRGCERTNHGYASFEAALDDALSNIKHTVLITVERIEFNKTG